MKLHLPTGLRAALMAVFSLAAIATPAAVANDTPFQFNASAAKYGYTIQKEESFAYLTSSEISKITIPSMEENWVISVAGRFEPQYMVYNGTEGHTAGGVSSVEGAGVIAGNTKVPVYYEDWTGNATGRDVIIHKPTGLQTNQFAVLLTVYGDIYVVNKRGVKKICNIESRSWNSLVEISLRWEYNEDTGTGSLYLLSVGKYSDGNLVSTRNPQTNTYEYTDVIFSPSTANVVYDEMFTILEDVTLTTEEMEGFGGLFTDINEFSYHKDTLYSAGSKDDPKAWLITGLTDLEKLQTTKAYGKVLFDDAHKVQFTGGSGALIYTGNGTYTYEHLNNSVDTNILMGDLNANVGFGAWKKGSKLIIPAEVLAVTHTVDAQGRDVVLNNDLVASGLKVYGQGTLKMELGENSTLNLKAMASGSTLEFSNTKAFYNENNNRRGFNIDLANASIGSGASIIRTEDCTVDDLFTLSFYSWKDDKHYKFDTLKNEKGHLGLYGGQIEFSDSGKIKEQATSVVEAKNIAATSWVNFWGGTFKVDNINAGSGVEIGHLSEFNYSPLDYRRTTVYVGNELITPGNVIVKGSAHIGKTTAHNVTFKYDSTISNKLTADSIKAEKLTIDVSDEANPILDENKNDLPVIPCGATITLHDNAAEDTKLVSNGFSASVSGTLTSINAGKISDSVVDIQTGTYIEEIPSNDGSDPTIKRHTGKSTIINADALSNIDFTYTHYEYNEDAEEWAPQTVTTVLENASGTNVTLSTSSVIATSLKADRVTLPSDSYTMSFGSLNVTDTLDAGDSQYTGNVAMTGVTKLKSKALTAATVSADDITLSDEFVFNSATGAQATVHATNDIWVGEGSTLNNASISTGGELYLNTNTTLNNVTLGGVVKTSGTIKFNSAGLSGMNSQFGGEDGNAFAVDKDSAGVKSINMNAVIEGSELTIDHLTIYGEDLQFTSTGETYDVITPNTGDIYYDVKSTNYELYIKPWVRSEVQMNNGSAVITGREDEQGIKDELRTSQNRDITIDAINELGPIASDGSALGNIHDYLGHIHRYSQAQREQVLDAISGASMTALADSQRRGIEDVQNNLRNRVIQMGGGTNDGFNTEWAYSGLQAWAQADGGLASISGGEQTPGYDYNTTGATVGANLDITPNLVMGLSLSASYGKIKCDGADHASGNNDSQHLSVFARYQSSRWVQMLILTAGKNEMDLSRNVLGYSGKGDTKGSSLSAYYELGYTMGLNYDYTHIIQPLVSVRFTKADVDKYTEAGTLGAACLEYDSQNLTYGSVGVGARYQGVMYTSVHERNAVAEARVLVSQDFGDKTDEVQVAFVDGSKHKVKGADTTGIGFEIGGGISIPVQQHTTLYADADVTFNGDYNSFRANVGLRYDF